MEYHQHIQNRTAQTIPVLVNHAPTLTIDGKGAPELEAAAAALETLAQTRDNLLFASDVAVRDEFSAFRQIRLLTLKIPALIEALLEEDHPAVQSLDAVYAITPRTTESALERARALRPMWAAANSSLTGRVPAQPPITRNGVDIGAFDALLAGQADLEQAVENAAQDLRTSRLALRTAAVALDKLNKRFYKALAAEADPGTPLEDALKGIDTASSNLPQTLSIDKVLQGGEQNLHVLVNYDAGTFDEEFTNTIEWQVVGTDADFAHSVAADPSGNALGPFAVGATVRLRTRVQNANGTTTGSVRSITLAEPVA